MVNVHGAVIVELIRWKKGNILVTSNHWLCNGKPGSMPFENLAQLAKPEMRYAIRKNEDV